MECEFVKLWCSFEECKPVKALVPSWFFWKGILSWPNCKAVSLVTKDKENRYQNEAFTNNE